MHDIGDHPDCLDGLHGMAYQPSITRADNYQTSREDETSRISMRRMQFGYTNGQGVQSYEPQLAEIRTNAIPWIAQDKEEEEMLPSNCDLEAGSMRGNYSEQEQQREQEIFVGYLDEEGSEKLPNALDLVSKRNLQHLLGAKIWFLPSCNTTNDGWNWEPSKKWIEARERIRRQRGNQWRESEERANKHWESCKEDQDCSKCHYGGCEIKQIKS